MTDYAVRAAAVLGLSNATRTLSADAQHVALHGVGERECFVASGGGR